MNTTNIILLSFGLVTNTIPSGISQMSMNTNGTFTVTEEKYRIVSQEVRLGYLDGTNKVCVFQDDKYVTNLDQELTPK